MSRVTGSRAWRDTITQERALPGGKGDSRRASLKRCRGLGGGLGASQGMRSGGYRAVRFRSQHPLAVGILEVTHLGIREVA